MQSEHADAGYLNERCATVREADVLFWPLFDVLLHSGSAGGRQPPAAFDFAEE